MNKLMKPSQKLYTHKKKKKIKSLVNLKTILDSYVDS